MLNTWLKKAILNPWKMSKRGAITSLALMGAAALTLSGNPQCEGSNTITPLQTKVDVDNHSLQARVSRAMEGVTTREEAFQIWVAACQTARLKENESGAWDQDYIDGLSAFASTLPNQTLGEEMNSRGMSWNCPRHITQPLTVCPPKATGMDCIKGGKIAKAE